MSPVCLYAFVYNGCDGAQVEYKVMYHHRYRLGANEIGDAER